MGAGGVERGQLLDTYREEAVMQISTEVARGSAASTSQASLLRREAITKEFPGVRALSNVSFDLHRGEVHAVCGENGAGKSTLMKIISGVYQPTSGTIVYRSEEHTSELQSLMRISYAVFCLKNKNKTRTQQQKNITNENQTR